MNQPEARNPEQRSNNAILCFCIGAGVTALAYVLGFGGVIAAALSGEDPIVTAGGMGAMVALIFAGVSGGVLMAVSTVWMIVRVIADQMGDKDEARYRKVER